MNTTIVKFEDIELSVVEDSTHEWLLDTALVAKGYGTSEESIRSHKGRKKDELIEGKHFITVAICNGGESQTFWTKRGVIRLGFFIRSKNAIKFRDFAEDLVINRAEQKPLSQLEILVQSAQILLEQDRRISTVESKVEAILKKQHEAKMELKALPVSSEKVPEMSLRDKCRLLVNRYCSATGTYQQTVWDNIYQTLYYNFHIAIKGYQKINKSESWLQVADRKGFIDRIYIIISNLLKDKGIAA